MTMRVDTTWAEVTICDLVAGGAGRAELEGRQLFVPLTVPGERVRVSIVRHHRDYLEGRLMAVLTPSSDRVVPRCPVFGDCGGCQWQHLRYEGQLRWKEEIMREQLRRIGRMGDVAVLPTIAADDPWHYRSRIQLHVDEAGHVGFFRAGTHEVVEFDHCSIADVRLNAQLETAKQRIRTTGAGRQLCVEATEGFRQVNPAQNARLQQLVAEGVAARAHATVLELYCGSGNFSFPLAAVAEHVVAVDDHRGAIAQTQQEVVRRRLSCLEFYCTSALRWLKRLLRDGTRLDGVLLDPPRRGAREILEPLLRVQPSWIGYISCNPATLARDLRILCDGGYRVESCQPIDMFPQTAHIESLTWLERSD